MSLSERADRPVKLPLMTSTRVEKDTLGPAMSVAAVEALTRNQRAFATLSYHPLRRGTRRSEPVALPA